MQCLKSVGTANPLVLIDEIDKVYHFEIVPILFVLKHSIHFEVLTSITIFGKHVHERPYKFSV